MIPDGSYTAVVDRIEDALATLELEGDDDLYGLVVDEGLLPAEARHQDAILRVVVEDEELADASYDEAETEARRGEAQDRFDRLSERPGGDDDPE